MDIKAIVLSWLNFCEPDSLITSLMLCSSAFCLELQSFAFSLPHLPYHGACSNRLYFSLHVTLYVSNSLTLKVVKKMAATVKRGKNLARQLKI